MLGVKGAVGMSVSIHAPLARGDGWDLSVSPLHDVSIHAPLARGDDKIEGDYKIAKVSIHAPLARGDRPA